jgi:aryl-alcohol dehydrogenase-like predicted oxidoreductase
VKLALGTVQFGLPYGVSNKSGQVDSNAVANILTHARSAGINTLDTAISYGASEQCLGEIGVDGWEIISKLPELPDSCADVSAWVRDQVKGSLLRLNVERLSGLLLHLPGQLLGSSGRELWVALQNLRNEGLFEKIGFSIYDPDELEALFPSYRPDLVQGPYNILDRRLATSGWLRRMNQEGVEVHVRSVFLQGLLLMSKSDRPRKFDRWSSVWSFWDDWLNEQGFTAIQTCLSFAMADENICKVIVGVDDLTQLKELLSSVDTLAKNFPQNLETDDRDLIIPSNWNSL